MKFVYFGQIVHAKSFTDFEIFTDGYVAVVDGKVSFGWLSITDWNAVNQY
jgi:hypothetical protein